MLVLYATDRIPARTVAVVVLGHVARVVEMQGRGPGVVVIYRRRPIVALLVSIAGITRAEIAVAGGREKDSRICIRRVLFLTIEPETLQASMIGIFTVICPLRSER